VSVVISSVPSGFSLSRTLGSPTDAAETLFRISLAPEGSGRTATLLHAEEDRDRHVYQFEYTVDRGSRGPPLCAISVIATRQSNTLLTLTVVAPLKRWKEDELLVKKFRKIASSFHVV
jgi:hypothetical protein